MKKSIFQQGRSSIFPVKTDNRYDAKERFFSRSVCREFSTFALM